jgi:hypothetical protein
VFKVLIVLGIIAVLVILRYVCERLVMRSLKGPRANNDGVCPMCSTAHSDGESTCPRCGRDLD